MITDLRTIRSVIGGEITGNQLLTRGPGHKSPNDRSLSIRLSASAPDGFLAFSHASDDWRTCRDYVKAAIGLPTDRPATRPQIETPRAPEPPQKVGATTTADALKLWAEGVDPRGTLAALYLAGRGLDLPEKLAGDVLRWHRRAGALLALFRCILSDEPKAISRAFIDDAGLKTGRKFLGPVRGCAVKLDADEEVMHGVHVAEGIETSLAARQIGLKPTWALGSASAIAAFPVLSGVEALTFLRERDDANARAAEDCGRRWIEAGREVFNIWPSAGKDMNDAIRGPVK